MLIQSLDGNRVIFGHPGEFLGEKSRASLKIKAFNKAVDDVLNSDVQTWSNDL